jgi:tetratricopeptide (TPR) repeat protein
VEHDLVAELIHDTAVAADCADRMVQRAGGVTVELCAEARFVDYEAQHGRNPQLPDGLSEETRSSFARPWSILTQDARLVLRAACLFEPSRVPAKDLRALFEAQTWEARRFDRAADALHDRTLILPAGDTWRIHALIAEFVRSQAEPVLPDALYLLHLERFTGAAKDLSENPADARRIARFLAYSAQLSFWQGLGAAVAAQVGRRSHSVGYALTDIGRFDQALPWFERAVQEAQQGDVHGRIDHESLGRSLHQVGSCHSRSGRFDQALPWFERAVQEKQQGDLHGRVDHESLSLSQARLAEVRRRLGREGAV